MAEQKPKQTEFVYNENMEKQFGVVANGPTGSSSYKFGDRTFANQRAIQGGSGGIK